MQAWKNLFSAVLLAAAGAADYPVRPVRIVVLFAPGGGTEVAEEEGRS